MRVLIVGMSGSVHAARFMELLEGSGWDVHLFEATAAANPHPDLPACTLHAARLVTELPGPHVRHVPAPPRDPARDGLDAQVDHLEHVIDTLRPDLVHAHESSLAGALVDRVHVRRGGLPVPWLLTNWGSDLFWFGRVPRYVERLKSIMRHCPYLNAECHRDVALARAFGFRGRVVGVWPVAGGLDADAAQRLRSPGPTSARRTVAIKGVSRLYGAAMTALDALERCGDLLGGWELAGYQIDEPAEERAAEVAARTGMTYRTVSGSEVRDVPHDEILAMHGRARVSIGMNHSDAISTSFLEALSMGAFPVQAKTSCGYELTPPGRGALFVSPTDVDGTAAALRRALTDDDLVDRAAELNRRVLVEHLDRRRVRARVLDGYERIVGERALEAA